MTLDELINELQKRKEILNGSVDVIISSEGNQEDIWSIHFGEDEQNENPCIIIKTDI